MWTTKKTIGILSNIVTSLVNPEPEKESTSLHIVQRPSPKSPKARLSSYRLIEDYLNEKADISIVNSPGATITYESDADSYYSARSKESLIESCNTDTTPTLDSLPIINDDTVNLPVDQYKSYLLKLGQ